MSRTATSLPAPRTLPTHRSAGVVVAAALALALLALAGGLLLSGAAAPAALLDPGVLVRWGLPVVTVLVHLSAMTTTGGLTLCAVVLPAGGQAWRRAATVSAVAALSWAVVQALHLVLTHASVMGTGIGGPGYLVVLVQFIAGIELGTTLAWAVALTALTAALAVFSASPSGARWAAVAACLALVPLAGLGHAAGAGSHELAVSAMWLHLLGIGWWAGALAVLFLATVGTSEQLSGPVTRFSTIAGWAVLLVVVSGAVNGAIRMTGPLQLLTTPWGQLLTVKLVAFGLLGVAGWWHRRATIPLLAARDGGRSGPFWRLVVVELLVMAAVVGVSVALGSTNPPVPQERLSEGAELAGRPVPWFAGLVSQWRIDPLFLLLAGAGVWVYASWVRRLRKRGDAWSAGRSVSWHVGMVLVVWVTSGGPAVYGEALFSVHMLQHMLLLSVVPVLLVLGAPVSLAVRALPRREDGTQGPRELLLGLLHTRWAQFFAHPVVAAINVVVSMAVFYFSPLYELAMRSHVVHVASVLHFGLVGYLFINVLVGVDPGPRRPPYPVRLVLLLPSMVFHTFFGLFLVSSTSLLLAPSLALTGIDPLADQQVGGAVTWAMGELPALGLAFIVAMRWAADDERSQRRRVRRAPQSLGPPAAS